MVVLGLNPFLSTEAQVLIDYGVQSFSFGSYQIILLPKLKLWTPKPNLKVWTPKPNSPRSQTLFGNACPDALRRFQRIIDNIFPRIF